MTIRRNGPLELFLSDVVRLRKPHPCGSYDWIVVRLGADIGLRCQGCARRVLLPRRELERRLKTFVSRGPDFGGVNTAEAEGSSDPGAGAGTVSGLEENGVPTINSTIRHAH
jgi:hypothetical protein